MLIATLLLPYLAPDAVVQQIRAEHERKACLTCHDGDKTPTSWLPKKNCSPFLIGRYRMQLSTLPLRFDVSLQSWKLKRNRFMPRGGFDQGRIKHTNFEDETPGDTAWRLILSDNPTEIARVEAAYGRTQAQTVDDLLSIVAGVRLSRAMWAARAQLGNGFPLCAPIGTRLIERFIEGNM